MWNCAQREWKLIILALGFLTRLAPARVSTEQDLRDSVKYYPIVGLILGCIVTIPFALGFGNGHPWTQAFLYLCLNLWLTRGLHMDGLSDLADAWGSLKGGELFWKVLKDSRIGAFGCLAIVLATIGTILAVHDLLVAKFPYALCLPPILARAAALLFMSVTPTAAASTLAKMLAAGSTPALGAATLGLACLAGSVCLGVLPSAAALLLTLFFVFYLKQAALKAGGMNGDFIGALIVLSETATLFCFVVLK